MTGVSGRKKRKEIASNVQQPLTGLATDRKFSRFPVSGTPLAKERFWLSSRVVTDGLHFRGVAGLFFRISGGSLLLYHISLTDHSLCLPVPAK